MKKGHIDRLDMLVAIGLYGVSTWSSIQFFKELSGAALSDWLPNVVRAITFEGARAVLWVKGILNGNKWFKRAALYFTAIAMVASTGYMLASINRGQVESNAGVGAVASNARAVEQVDRQIEAQLKRLAETPPEFVSASERLSKELAALKKERAALVEEGKRVQNESIGMERKGTAGAMFTAVAQIMGFGERGTEIFRLLYLMALMLGTEVGTLMLSHAAIKEGADGDADGDKVQGEGDGDEVLLPDAGDTHHVGDRGEVQPEGQDPGLDDPNRKIAAISFMEDGSPRSHVFVSAKRAWDMRRVTPEEYGAIVQRGMMAGVLRQVKGRIYIPKGVTKERFLEEIEAWPN